MQILKRVNKGFIVYTFPQFLERPSGESCVFLRSSQDGILCKNAVNGPTETAKNDNHTYMEKKPFGTQNWPFCRTTAF